MKKLPERWKECKLIDIIELHYGKGLIEQDRKNGNIPVYGSNGIVGYHNEYLVKGPGIIIGRKGSVGEIKYSPLDFFPIDTTYYVSPKKEIDIKYMYYFLLTLRLDEMNSHSAVPGLNRSSVHSINIAIPPLTEQRKIAEILETADKAIEKTDAIIEKYRRIKQGLMRDLLTKGIDEKGQIRSEETHKFKDSPLGRLPEEWEVVRLGEIISVYDKKRIPLDSEFRLTIKGNIPYCGATGVIDYINDYIFDGEYLLIAEDGGNFGRFEETAYMMKGKFWANNHVHILRGRDGMSDNNFLMYFINFQDISCYISGSTREKLNQALLKSIIIPLPPLPEQHRIASVLSQIDEVIEKEERYKEKLERIKQGLMQDLLTGKVRVNHLIKET